jgi:hypothetical protein
MEKKLYNGDLHDWNFLPYIRVVNKKIRMRLVRCMAHIAEVYGEVYGTHS